MVYSLVTSQVTIMDELAAAIYEIVTFGQKTWFTGRKSQIRGPIKERGPRTALLK